MHRSTASGLQPGLAPSADGAEQVGEQQPVDDEARDVGDLDRGLAERVAQRAGPLARVSARLGGKASSISFIRGTGLKTCRPTKRSGWPLARASSVTDSEEVVWRVPPRGSAWPARLGEHRRLAAVVLDDRLDEERGVGQGVEVGRRPAPARGRSALRRASSSVFATVARARSAERVRARPQQHVAVARGCHGQPARDRARAGDSESFLQALLVRSGVTRRQ